ncbi:MAG TPA: pyruvate kinase [Actinomycetes bacterium]|nr:pyruvate kinase [Actinomycetes bacterium]
MRRAKIVATLGPASSTAGTVMALVESGMDVARLNLSHGDYTDHEKALRLVRQAAEVTGRVVGVLADLQGPKIRVGRFGQGPVLLQRGATFTITAEDVVGTAELVSTTHTGLADDVKPGDPILVDDGRIALEVVAVEGPRVVTVVVEGGTVSDNKGINLPGAMVSVPAVSDKDILDLRWALAAGVDLVALSFVRKAGDIEPVLQVMAEEGVKRPVIAKIEKPQAVNQLAEIIEAFDGIMVARGDLGVELPLEEVPLVQKRAVSLAREKGKPVIVATQMLESMIGASRPTRAETSDVANAILDGADALMLSGETSIGSFPVESVETMGRIIEAIEDTALDRIPMIAGAPTTKAGAIARAAVAVAQQLGAKFLVAFTETGRTPTVLARYRSRVPLLAFTPDPQVRNQLALTWGVESFLVDSVTHTDHMVRQVEARLLEFNRCVVGDHVTIVAGSPPGIPGSTNAMRVHKIGDAGGGAAPAYATE